MTIPTLHYTVGLPASGKTTWARELCRIKPRTVRANRDDLRQLLHEGRFSGGNEKVVTKVQEAVIRAGLADGRDVVVDDTNTLFWASHARPAGAATGKSRDGAPSPDDARTPSPSTASGPTSSMPPTLAGARRA